MKKIANAYIASATDIKKAMAHTRAMARKAPYDGAIECWFNPENGKFLYMECVGESWYEGASLVYVGSAACHLEKF